MATEEKVLCFERKLLEKLGVFQGLSLEVEKYLPLLDARPSDEILGYDENGVPR